MTTPGDVSRFPYSSSFPRTYGRVERFTPAQLAAREAAFFAKWQRALVVAEIAVKHETNLTIARIRARRERE